MPEERSRKAQVLFNAVRGLRQFGQGRLYESLRADEREPWLAMADAWEKDEVDKLAAAEAARG